MNKKFYTLLRLKGVWIPLVIGILYISLYSANSAESYFKFLVPIKSIKMQYHVLFFFCCLPLYFINKINFNYINSQFVTRKSLLNRLQLLFSLSVSFTALTAIISLITFSIYGIPFSDIYYLEIIGYIFLYSLFCCTLFNYLLSLQNSMGFLFLIYFLPTIEIIGTIISRQFNLDIEKFFPFRLGANQDNLILILILLPVFSILSVKSHKTYYL